MELYLEIILASLSVNYIYLSPSIALYWWKVWQLQPDLLLGYQDPAMGSNT